MKTRDIEQIMPDDMLRTDHEPTRCPSVRDWPEDAFSKWVASNRTQMQGMVCREPEYIDSPFCERDVRSSSPAL